MEKAKTRPHIILNNIKVYKDLPLVCKKTFTNNNEEWKNNELFTVINFDSKTIEVQSKRLTTTIKYESLNIFRWDIVLQHTVHNLIHLILNIQFMSIDTWNNAWYIQQLQEAIN